MDCRDMEQMARMYRWVAADFRRYPKLEALANKTDGYAERLEAKVARIRELQTEICDIERSN